MAFPFVNKDPNDVKPFHVIWGSLSDATNDGSSSDTGELQGATISSQAWTVPDGITKDSESLAEQTIRGVTYAINTIATITLSSGVVGTDYDILNRVTLSDGRVLDKTFTVTVREN